MLAGLCRLFLGVGLLSMAACSTYQRRWEAAARATATSADPLAGSYAGTWESTRYNNARGALWCIVQRTAARAYTAEFRATWHGIFSSEHSVNLEVSRRKQVKGAPLAQFEGTAEINTWIGAGRYRCAGTLTPEALVAAYDSTFDAGTFRLTRMPAQAGALRRPAAATANR